jgi:hypothetical protein
MTVIARLLEKKFAAQEYVFSQNVSSATLIPVIK